MGMDAPIFAAGTLWSAALAAGPVALAAAVIGRWLPCRPATRHSLLAVVLMVLLAAPCVPAVVAGARAVREAAGAWLARGDGASGAELEAAAGGTAVEPAAGAEILTSPTPVREVMAAAPARRAAGSEPVGGSGLRGVEAGSPSLLSAAGPAREERVRGVAGGAGWDKAASARRERAGSSVVPLVSVREEGVAGGPADVGGEGWPAVAGAARPLLERAWSAVLLWGAYVREVHGAVVRAPAVRGDVWACGSALIVVVTGVRIALGRRVLRGASRAPEGVERMVAAAAAEMGVRRVPRTVLVPRRVSPMIWCGVRALLVLPGELWDELDEEGRRAVVRHELAHLRRRDHWMCWAEMAACALYWWHPLVWWLRRRLREEADLCCDAWVTALMPRDRRAYAQALLETRRFISDARSAARPVVGLGVMTGGARRFARRLTMVMTHRTMPGRSLPGTALVAAIGLAGLASTPLWACPPEEEGQRKREVEVRLLERGPHDQNVRVLRAPKAPGAKGPRVPRGARVNVAPPAPPVPPSPPAPPAPPAGQMWGGEEEGPSTFERHMLRRGRADQSGARGGGDPSGSGGVEERLEQLERRLDRLNDRLERMMERFDRVGAAPGGQDAEAVEIVTRALGEEGDSRATVVVVRPGSPVWVYRFEDDDADEVAALLNERGRPVEVEVVTPALRALTFEDLGPELNLRIAEQVAAATGLPTGVGGHGAGVPALVHGHGVRGMHGPSVVSGSVNAAAAERAQAAAKLQRRAAEMTARAARLSANAEAMLGTQRGMDEAERARVEERAAALREQADTLNDEAEALGEEAEAILEEMEEMIEGVIGALVESVTESIEAPEPPEAPEAPLEIVVPGARAE